MPVVVYLSFDEIGAVPEFLAVEDVLVLAELGLALEG